MNIYCLKKNSANLARAGVVVRAAHVDDDLAGVDDVGLAGADDGGVAPLREELEHADRERLVAVERPVVRADGVFTSRHGLMPFR